MHLFIYLQNYLSSYLGYYSYLSLFISYILIFIFIPPTYTELIVSYKKKTVKKQLSSRRRNRHLEALRVSWVKLWKTIRHTGRRRWHSMKRSWQWGGMRLKIRSRGNMKTAMPLLWKWNKNRNISLWWASTPSLPVCILGSFSNRTVETMLWYIT